MQRPWWSVVLSVAALLAPLGTAFLRGQEPTTAPPPPTLAPQTPAPTTAESGKKKYSHAHDFLIRGTVFNEKALSFPGVQLRIRRAGEKKTLRESLTNSRGEFAIRVPQGAIYEVVVRAKGFADQTRTIDTKTGENEGNMVFRMQPTAGDKK